MRTQITSINPSLVSNGRHTHSEHRIVAGEVGRRPTARGICVPLLVAERAALAPDAPALISEFEVQLKGIEKVNVTAIH